MSDFHELLKSCETLDLLLLLMVFFDGLSRFISSKKEVDEPLGTLATNGAQSNSHSRTFEKRKPRIVSSQIPFSAKIGSLGTSKEIIQDG
jgi:hypothetical protein